MKRKVGAVLCLLAIAAVLTGAFTRRWIVERDVAIRGKNGVGLLRVERCDQVACKVEHWDQLDYRGADLIGHAGKVAAGGSLLLALVLALSATSAVLRPRRSVTGGAVTALLLATVAGAGGAALAVAMRVIFKAIPMTFGWSAYIYVAGAGLALLGSILLIGQPAPAAMSTRAQGY